MDSGRANRYDMSSVAASCKALPIGEFIDVARHIGGEKRRSVLYVDNVGGKLLFLSGNRLEIHGRVTLLSLLLLSLPLKLRGCLLPFDQRANLFCGDFNSTRQAGKGPNDK